METAQLSYQSWTVHDPSPAVFVSGVASNSSKDEAFLPLCIKKRAVNSHFCSHKKPSNGRNKHCCAKGITGRDVRVSGRVTYFCSPLWSAGESCTQLVMLSLLTAGARLNKPRAMRHVRMLHGCSVLCMHTPKCIFKSF